MFCFFLAQKKGCIILVSLVYAKHLSCRGPLQHKRSWVPGMDHTRYIPYGMREQSYNRTITSTFRVPLNHLSNDGVFFTSYP